MLSTTTQLLFLQEVVDNKAVIQIDPDTLSNETEIYKLEVCTYILTYNYPVNPVILQLHTYCM